MKAREKQYIRLQNSVAMRNTPGMTRSRCHERAQNEYPVTPEELSRKYLSSGRAWSGHVAAGRSTCSHSTVALQNLHGRHRPRYSASLTLFSPTSRVRKFKEAQILERGKAKRHFSRNNPCGCAFGGVGSCCSGVCGGRVNGRRVNVHLKNALAQRRPASSGITIERQVCRLKRVCYVHHASSPTLTDRAAV